MTTNTNKDDTVRERIIEQFQIDNESANDVMELIRAHLGSNNKEHLTNDINEVYGEKNVDIEGFVNWTWALYSEDEAHEETKNDADKAQVHATNSSNQAENSSNDIKTTEVPKKKGRPAIYDEHEKNMNIQNIRDFHNNNKAKNVRNNDKKPMNNPPKPNNININGKRPLPPAPKEEKKSSILERIIKPGDKDKKNLNTKPSQPEKKIVLTSKKEQIIKKVKPNPENITTKSNIQAPMLPSQGKAASSTKVPESDQAQDPNDPQKLKIRCRNWPFCKNEETCAFHHPTEPCKNFPACRFGDKCLYIHPSVPCKFQANCQRPNCNYTHPKMPAQYYGFRANPTRKPMKGHAPVHQAAGASQENPTGAQNGGEGNE